MRLEQRTSLRGGGVLTVRRGHHCRSRGAGGEITAGKVATVGQTPGGRWESQQGRSK